jgi:hypothetical protein
MDPKITDRLGEASSWAGLAAALWGAVALAPEWLAGGLGMDVAGWRVVCVIAALAATLVAILKPECPQCSDEK